MIEIDGSFGEGGGQILRTALSLSCLFQKPFRISNIRKGRKKPGLMPQHLTGVKAAQLLTRAEVQGDHAGSIELSFSPGKVKGGSFFFDIGTAGSTMLVLQTLIPSLIFSGVKTVFTLVGGTHVPFSPSFHYVRDVFLPFLKKTGVEITLSIESYGFYPKGGGRITAELFPAKEVVPLRIAEKGKMLRVKGVSCVGNLPLSIAERQRNAALEKLHSHDIDYTHHADIEVIKVPSLGQGTFIFLKAESEHSVAGFTALGERGKRAEAVGEEAATELIQYLRTDTALDPHLADQIVLYLSLSKKQSLFTSSRITSHLLTNLWVIGLFHEFGYFIEGETEKPGSVRIN
ncbi:MAG TPA: RNA 3'-terminal phosphate cyclase [Thermodesulfovibrionales bacterium]|nr:RNA 3'-terminal phosphate cyclase [Thermodesulfovibrionales bacterium]